MEMLARLACAAAVLACVAVAAPSGGDRNRDVPQEPPARVLYDESQEGKWNVRADLKNFVVLIIPTRTSSPSPSPSLLDFFRKSVQNRQQQQSIDDAKKPQEAQETQHFIESKTAPYHVDISSDKGSDDVIIANSPTIALLKNSREGHGLESTLSRARRLARAVVFSVPVDEEYVLTKTEEQKKVVKKDNVKKDVTKKKVVKNGPKHELKLLGAELEQCGPGMARDSYGNCRVYDP